MFEIGTQLWISRSHRYLEVCSKSPKVRDTDISLYIVHENSSSWIILNLSVQLFTLYLIFVYNYLQLADKVQMRDAVRQSEDVHIEQVGQRWRSSCDNVHVYIWLPRYVQKCYKWLKFFCNFYQKKKFINTK